MEDAVGEEFLNSWTPFSSAFSFYSRGESAIPILLAAGGSKG